MGQVSLPSGLIGEGKERLPTKIVHVFVCTGDLYHFFFFSFFIVQKAKLWDDELMLNVLRCQLTY